MKRKSRICEFKVLIKVWISHNAHGMGQEEITEKNNEYFTLILLLLYFDTFPTLHLHESLLCIFRLIIQNIIHYDRYDPNESINIIRYN